MSNYLFKMEGGQYIYASSASYYFFHRIIPDLYHWP